MSDPKDPPTPEAGRYSDPPNEPGRMVERVAVILSVLWLGVSALFFLVWTPTDEIADDSMKFLLIALTVFLPVAMIWVAAVSARASRVMREESQRLQAAIDAMRNTYITQNAGAGNGGAATGEASVTRKLDEIAAAQRKTETALATFSTSRQITPVHRLPKPSKIPADGDGQVALPLGTPLDETIPPLESADFIRALNFPENADDKAGFAALRKALKDRPTAQLIQAAQDVLTLLSQDGIYMDDLRPDMARPEIWQRFAGGERGRQIAALGGIRDRSSLALSAARMKSDPIFRDAAHHFLRKFDRMISVFAETASDAELSDLSDTRTARAFMLLGRVAGTFD